MRTYEIELKGCAFFAYHGVLDEEAETGQRFFVDAHLRVEDRGSLASDEIEGTVHYGEAFEEIERIVTTTRRRLIETLADDICRALISRWSQIAQVRIAIHKPAAPIRGVLDDVVVRVAMEREE